MILLLFSSGGSCHFAVLRNSLISLALEPPASSVPGVATPLAWVSPKPSRHGKHAAGLARTRSSTVASSVSCPINSLSVTATTRGPKSQLCSARKHLTADSVHAFAPPVGPLQKIIAVHQNVRLQVFVENGTETPRVGKILQSPRRERNALATVGLHPWIRTLFTQCPAHSWLLRLGGSSSGSRTYTSRTASS